MKPDGTDQDSDDTGEPEAHPRTLGFQLKVSYPQASSGAVDDGDSPGLPTLRIEVRPTELVEPVEMIVNPLLRSVEFLDQRLEDRVAMAIAELVDLLDQVRDAEDEADRDSATAPIRAAAEALGLEWSESPVEWFKGLSRRELTTMLKGLLREGRRIFRDSRKRRLDADAAEEARRAVGSQVRHLMWLAERRGCQPDYDAIRYKPQWQEIFSRPSTPGKDAVTYLASELLGTKRERKDDA